LNQEPEFPDSFPDEDKGKPNYHEDEPEAPDRGLRKLLVRHDVGEKSRTGHLFLYRRCVVV